jgi:hypothetical protein
MKLAAFISRHNATSEQQALATAQGFQLVSVGDMDAFTVTHAMVAGIGQFDAVCVVHPAAALRLQSHFDVLVFENGTRPADGGAPAFFAKALHVFKASPITAW